MIKIFQHTRYTFSEALFLQLGRGRQHAMALYSHWFRSGELLSSVEPQAMKLLQEMISITDFTLPAFAKEKNEGETFKFILRFADGLESESVLIPMESGITICISSQVGCKMGCSFCETGKMGLIRHLTSEEIYFFKVFYAQHI